MKPFYLFAYLFLCVTSFTYASGDAKNEHAKIHKEEDTYQIQNRKPRHIIIHQNTEAGGDSYLIDSEIGYLGSLVKACQNFRKHYSVYNDHGKLVSSAYSRLFSFGALFNYSTVLDIYDGAEETGRIIGTIEGSLPFNNTAHEFDIYNAHNKHVGAVYSNQSRTTYKIYDPLHKRRIIAALKKVDDQDQDQKTCFWQLDIVDPYAIDTRILLTFGALLIDIQD